jgi:hypothetical protein
MRAVTRRRLAARLIRSPVALAIARAGIGCSSSPAKSTLDGGGDASLVNVAWDWVGVVGTGQSLSVGGNAPSVTATQQPYHNLKLSFGGATVAPPFDATIPTLAVVPLIEPIRPIATSYPSAYPDNIYGETPHTALTGGSYATRIHSSVQLPARTCDGHDLGRSKWCAEPS